MSLCEDRSGCDADAVWRLWGHLMREGFTLACDDHGDEPCRFRERMDGKVVFEGSRVQLAREVCGYSREDLAELVGTTEYELWDWEVNEVLPGDEAIGRMVKALNFPQPFYERPSVISVGLGSLAFHYPEDVCQVCELRFAEALCDARVGGGTCDKRLCSHCRRRHGAKVDYCRQHDAQLRMAI